jgi:hypothetical protein
VQLVQQLELVLVFHLQLLQLQFGSALEVQHRVRVRANYFPYPTAAGNAAPRRPQPAPGIQWPSFAAGMRCRGGPPGGAGGQVLPLLRAARLKNAAQCQRVQAHKNRRRCE